LACAQLHQPHGLPNAQDLDKQGFQLAEETLAEIGNRAVIRMAVGADEPAGDRIVGRLRELAAGEHPRGVSVKQQRHQHRRVIRSRACAPIGANQELQVELIDDLHDKSRQVFLRQVVLDTRGKQLRCVAVDQDELSWHCLLFRLSVVAANFTRYAGGKSDSLLGCDHSVNHDTSRLLTLSGVEPPRGTLIGRSRGLAAFL
jgi:hypothetical protein